jgi:purine-nucleoside phosphorylase
MDEPYSKRIISLASKIAEQKGFNLQKGVYTGLSGPYYGTPSESKAFFILGADAVGMSTVPENIVAKSLKMEVFAMSVITDLAVIGMNEDVSHEEVLQAATKASPVLLQLLYELLPQL